MLALSCCLGACSGQNVGQPFRLVQRFEREPEDQTAVVGETVVMACRVLNKSGVLQWTKDDFGLGSDRNLSGFERYSMIGTEDEGERLIDVDFVAVLVCLQRVDVESWWCDTVEPILCF